MACSSRSLSLVALLLLLLLLGAVLQPRGSLALRFDVSANAPKCFSEDLQSQVLVLADYRVVAYDSSHHTISVQVTSPYGTIVHDAEAVESGQFSFTTSESGIYTACFSVPPSERSLILHIGFDWKIGVAARDWDMVARKDKIEGVDLELTRLKEAVNMIRQTMAYLRKREWQVRNDSEALTSKVVWLSFIPIFICWAASVGQMMYMKMFFVKRKIL